MHELGVVFHIIDSLEEVAKENDVIIAVGYKAKEANMPKRKEVEEIAKFF